MRITVQFQFAKLYNAATNHKETQLKPDSRITPISRLTENQFAAFFYEQLHISIIFKAKMRD